MQPLRQTSITGMLGLTSLLVAAFSASAGDPAKAAAGSSPASGYPQAVLRIRAGRILAARRNQRADRRRRDQTWQGRKIPRRGRTWRIRRLQTQRRQIDSIRRQEAAYVEIPSSSGIQSAEERQGLDSGGLVQPRPTLSSKERRRTHMSIGSARANRENSNGHCVSTVEIRPGPTGSPRMSSIHRAASARAPMSKRLCKPTNGCTSPHVLIQARSATQRRECRSTRTVFCAAARPHNGETLTAVMKSFPSPAMLRFAWEREISRVFSQARSMNLRYTLASCPRRKS